MAIEILAAPAALIEVVSDGFRDLPPDDGWSKLGDAEVYSPIPVYSARLEDFARSDSNFIPDLELVGWRVLASRDDQLALAEARAIDGALIFVGVKRGVAGKRLAEASVILEGAVDQGSDWKAIIIDMPEVEVDVLALRSNADTLAVRLDVEAPEVTRLSAINDAARALARQRLSDRAPS